MEAEVSLPHLKVSATCPYPEPDRPSPCPHPTSWRSILILSSHLKNELYTTNMCLKKTVLEATICNNRLWVRSAVRAQDGASNVRFYKKWFSFFLGGGGCTAPVQKKTMFINIRNMCTSYKMRGLLLLSKTVYLWTLMIEYVLKYFLTIHSYKKQEVYHKISFVML